MGSVPPGTRFIVKETNLRGYRGLTLDGFGSILDDSPVRVPAVLQRIVRAHGRRLDPLVLRERWSGSLRKYFSADPFLSFREVHRRAFQEVFDGLEISTPIDECIDAAFDAYHHVKAYPEVPEVIHELERDVPIAIVSNMDTKLLLEALQNNGLSFSFVITSEEEQRYKPHASPFRRAIRYLGLPAEHILHVGDSYAEDIVGAKSVGMACALMQRPGGSEGPQVGSSPVVHDLREVQDLIRRSGALEARED